MRSRWVGLGALVACMGKAQAPPPSRPVAAAPAHPPPTCVSAPEEVAAITHASGNMRRVQYCVGNATDQCFALDLVAGTLARLDAPPATAAPSDAARVETTNPELKICSGETCKTLTPQVWPGAVPLHAATNGAFAVVLLGDAAAGKGYAEVWEVATAKKLATIRYARGDFKCGDVAMLGDTIYLGASTCTSPSARGALYTVKGRKIANVGPNDFGTFGTSFVRVEGPIWAFLGENGAHIALQDVVKGKLLKTIDVGELWRRAASLGSAAKAAGGSDDAFGNPGESVLISLAPAKLGVIAGTPANGSVAIVDVNSGDVQIVRAPLCD